VAFLPVWWRLLVKAFRSKVKLGMDSRREVARWAVHHKLVEP
jgi:hypothetical protein